MKKKIAIVSCFDWFDMRLKFVKKAFEESGDSVEIFTSDFLHTNKQRIVEKNKECSYIKVLKYRRNISVARIISHLVFSRKVYSRLKKMKPDIIYAIVPPNSTAKYCGKYVRKNKSTKLIFDIMDMWPETMPIERIKRLPFMCVWKNMRDHYLSDADFVITECNLYRERLKNVLDDEKAKTIYVSREIGPLLKPEKNSEKSEIRLCYLGSINNIIDIDIIGEIIKHISSLGKKVRFDVIGDGEKKEPLLKKAKECGAKVVFHGKIFDYEKKMNLLQSSDLGLNIMKENVCVGLTLKSIDYFEASLPIINNIKGDTWSLVERKKIGYNLDVFFTTKLSDIEEMINNKNLVQKCFIQYFNSDGFTEEIKRIVNAVNSKQENSI